MVSYEEVHATYEESIEEISKILCKTSSKNSYEDSHEVLSKRSTKESNKEEYVCFKSIYKEDDDEVMSLTYKQMFALNVKLSKENEKLERNISSLNDHIEYF